MKAIYVNTAPSAEEVDTTPMGVVLKAFDNVVGTAFTNPEILFEKYLDKTIPQLLAWSGTLSECITARLVAEAKSAGSNFAPPSTTNSPSFALAVRVFDTLKPIEVEAAVAVKPSNEVVF